MDIKASAVPKYLYRFFLMVVLAGCSQEPPDSPSIAGGEVKGEISGPFPKTVRGTIGSSYPLDDGTGRIHLSLLEYENAAIIVSTETYNAKGMEEDDAEVSLTIEPISSEQCGDEGQCFKGY
jgi:hypothetical protein